VYTLDRTHRLGDDLSWLPRQLKALRWSTAGLCWVGTSGVALAATVASGGALAHLAAIATAGGIYAGSRLGRALMLRRLGRLARGDVDLARLAAESEGLLVHMSGRVSASETLPSFLHDRPAVYRRMTFRLGHRHFIHEAAVDFDIVDAAGSRLRVHVDDARLFAPPAKELADYPATLFTDRRLPPSLLPVFSTAAAQGARDAGVVPSAELVLRADAPVDIIGYKTEAIDPVAGTRIGRGPPLRVALRSGRIPLIISSPTPFEPPDTL